MKTVRKIRELLRQAWPWLSALAGLLAGIFLAPAEPTASWWPTADWAQHALTGLGVGLGILIVGAILGLVTGTISIPGFSVSKGPNADDLDKIREQIAEVVAKQNELTETATEALTLSKEAMRALLPDQSKTPLVSRQEERVDGEGDS